MSFSLTHPFQPLPVCVFQAPACELGEGGLFLTLAFPHQGLALLLQVNTGVQVGVLVRGREI